jgi:hypothetical protein
MKDESPKSKSPTVILQYSLINEGVLLQVESAKYTVVMISRESFGE